MVSDSEPLEPLFPPPRRKSWRSSVKSSSTLERHRRAQLKWLGMRKREGGCAAEGFPWSSSADRPTDACVSRPIQPEGGIGTFTLPPPPPPPTVCSAHFREAHCRLRKASTKQVPLPTFVDASERRFTGLASVSHRLTACLLSLRPRRLHQPENAAELGVGGRVSLLLHH